MRPAGEQRIQSPGEALSSKSLLDSPQSPQDGDGRALLWLRRVELFLIVVVTLYVGLLLIALPWIHFWDENHFFSVYTRLGRIAQTGAARGIVSGLGLLNLWIAVSDAVHFRDIKA